MKKILTTILTLIICTGLFGQSEGTYSQYMFNGLAINPAYAGIHDALNISALSRFQGVNVDGAPTTYTFSAHSSIINQRVGIGLLAVSDRIGISEQNGVYMTYSYRLKFHKATLAFGLQGGINMLRADYSDLLIFQPGDPRFPSQNISESSPNFGAGVFFHTPKFYAGFSMPQILDSNNEAITQIRPMILTSGAVFDLSPNVQLKPNVLVRMVDGRPVELNYNTNVLFHEVLWVGVSYRPNNTLNGILELQLTDQLRFGYAYDFTINDFSRADSGSHEIMLNYFLRFTKMGVVNPRYF